MIPPDIHTRTLPELEEVRRKLLARIFCEQAVLRKLRPATDRATVRAAAVTREQRDEYQRELRRVHETIEAVSCEEPCWTRPST